MHGKTRPRVAIVVVAVVRTLYARLAWDEEEIRFWGRSQKLRAVDGEEGEVGVFFSPPNRRGVSKGFLPSGGIIKSFCARNH